MHRYLSHWLPRPRQVATVLALLVSVNWSYFLYGQRSSSLENLVQPPVLFLTAHPDDEVMFFAPTILELVQMRAEVHVLCLSKGNADGLGDTRSKEFKNALHILGIHESSRHIIDHPELQDNITVKWDKSVIASVLESYLNAHHYGTILTFDDYGVSGHPNHASLLAGTLTAHTTSSQPLVFALVSRNRLLKFTGLLFPYTYPAAGHAIRGDVKGFQRTLKAMMEHSSQLVWFRWLYLAFSRYMWINDWVQVNR